MSIAFCFLTVGDLSQPELWARFFSDRNEVGIFCHPKNQHEISSECLKPNIIKDIVETEHGTVSLVAATLSLFRAAFDSAEFEHFILLSETTVPIAPLRQILDEAQGYKERSLISYHIPPPGSEHFNRQSALPRGIVVKPFFSHDQWLILSRRHLQKLLDGPRIEWFATMFAPDEHYFLNALAHECRIAPSEVINQRKTFVNWREREVKKILGVDGRVLKQTIHPKTYHDLRMSDVRMAQQEKMWFFRKVSSQCDCRELVNDIV